MIINPLNKALLFDESAEGADAGGGGSTEKSNPAPEAPRKPAAKAPAPPAIDYDKLAEAMERRQAASKKTSEPEEPEPKENDPASKRVAKLQQQLQDLQSRDAQREREMTAKEVKANVQSALGNFAFASPKAKADALDALLKEVKRLDDGTITGPGGEGLDEYIAEQLTNERAYLLAPKPAGGTNAEPNGRAGSKGFDIDSISPHMTEEQRRQAFAAIAPFMRR